MMLTEFLLARIAEDEELVRDIRRDEHLNERDLLVVSWAMVGPYKNLTITSGRMLAECEAKRRILQEHTLEGSDDDPDCRHTADEPCLTLRYLALPYADHPDYDEAWRA